MLYSISLIIFCALVYWFRSNAKVVFDLQWSPLEWWVYTSLLTTYANLTAWWYLRDVYDIWKATLIWQVILFMIEMVLNTYFFGFNPKAVLSLALIFVAVLIGLT